MQTKKWEDIEDYCRDILSIMIVKVRKLRFSNPDKEPSSLKYTIRKKSYGKPIIDDKGRKICIRRFMRMYRRVAKEWRAEYRKQGSEFYVRVYGNNNFV